MTVGHHQTRPYDVPCSTSLHGMQMQMWFFGMISLEEAISGNLDKATIGDEDEARKRVKLWHKLRLYNHPDKVGI